MIVAFNVETKFKISVKKKMEILVSVKQEKKSFEYCNQFHEKYLITLTYKHSSGF
jgi:hypothetical protein